MSKRLNPLAEIRGICLAWPGTREVEQFGHPWFKWKNKPFAIYTEDLSPDLSIKVEMEAQAVFLADERFFRTPYLGRRGWVTLRLEKPIDWEEVEELLRGSYELAQKAKKKQK
jgi:predicted DNA-binding protein (MmcQ/YjbR family)